MSYAEINSDNIISIMRAVAEAGTPKHLVLRGYMGRRTTRQHPWTVKVYGTKSKDIQETVEQEQPYSHYLGVYTADIDPADLLDDINAMIETKYRVKVCQ